MTVDLSTLNVPQRRAARHGRGPLLILAGAGSGKTRTMAYRMAHLMATQHVSPQSILGLSFTNKAALELKDRVRSMMKEAKVSSRGLTVSTFHSLCVRILRKYSHHIGFSADFAIMDQSDQLEVVRSILKEIKIDDRKFDPSWILFQMGHAKNQFLTGDEAEEYFLGADKNFKSASDYGIAAASVYPKYLTQLKSLNAMDFDDLLFHAVHLLENFEEVRTELNHRYQYLLVDEYQDTNPAQFRLLKALTTLHQNLCVVGDDDQSIYAWRGADPKHILEFKKHFPAAEVVILDQNYRSTNRILQAANEVISKNQYRHPKRLWSNKGEGENLLEIIVEEDRDESDTVAEELHGQARRMVDGMMQQVRPWSDFAVLYRSNAQARAFEEALRMRRIPYRLIGSYSFLDRKEVRDLFAYWKVILNPAHDPSLRRIANWPARGVGRGSLTKLGSHALESGEPLFDSFKEAQTIVPRTANGVLDLVEKISRLRGRLYGLPADPAEVAKWLKSMVETFDFRKGIQDDCSDGIQFETRWDNVEELCNGVARFEEDAEHPCNHGADVLREYLARLTLQAEEENSDEDKNKKKDEVTLLTLHSSKGLEFQVVFLVGVEDGILPHKRVIEEGTDLSEERRLCYVGLTRAQQKLIFTRAKFRTRWGKKVASQPSRFINDIPRNLIDTRDLSREPDLSTKKAQEEHETRVKGFLSQFKERLNQSIQDESR